MYKINFIMKNEYKITTKEVIVDLRAMMVTAVKDEDGLQETCLKKLATFFKMRGPSSIPFRRNVV